jgi:hypothetical protein
MNLLQEWREIRGLIAGYSPLAEFQQQTEGMQVFPASLYFFY